MARQPIKNSNASLYIAGSGNVSIASNAGTLVIGDSTHRTYTWGGKFRINPNTPTPASTFFTKASTKYPFQFRAETGERVRVAVYDGSANLTIMSPRGVADNTWHTLVGVRDDNTISFYIDGLLVGTNSTTLADMDEVSSISMASNGFIGNALDTFFTFNAFTATDALNHHLNGTIPYDCLFRLPLNEGGGSIAYDTSGNNNNGTITSGTWSLDTPTKTRRSLDGIPDFNGSFENIPTFVAATTTGDGCVDGTAAGSTYRSPNKYGWQIFSWAGTYSAQFDTAEKYSGTASMKLTLGATSSRIKVRRYSGTLAYSLGQEKIPCKPSTEYTMTYRMKTSLSGSATSGANITLSQYRQNGITGAGPSGTTGSAIKTTTDWTQYTLTLTTDATACFLTPEMNLIGDDGAATLVGSAWFDDIQLYPTTPVTRSAATGRLAATGRSAA